MVAVVLLVAQVVMPATLLFEMWAQSAALLAVLSSGTGLFAARTVRAVGMEAVSFATMVEPARVALALG